TSLQLLPDVTEDLATDPALPRLAVSEETLVGRKDDNAHAAEDPADTVGLAVDPQARLRHPLDAGDRALPLGGVLHYDDELAAGVAGVTLHPVAGDVALPLEDGGQRLLELGRGHDDLVVHGDVAVADTGQHVGDGIGHGHGRTYQEDLVTPGT